jgi:hypothetical protein
VRLPQTPRTRSALAIGIAATSALLLIGPGSTAASAGRLIGSAAIKNNTIRSLDIRNETITGRDVKDGSLTVSDISGSLRGPAGPRGVTGPRGPAADPVTVATWTAHFESTPNIRNAIAVYTDTPVPAGTQVEAVKVTVTGDFSSCLGKADMSLQVTDFGTGTALGSVFYNVSDRWLPARLIGGGIITSTPSKLRVLAQCGYGQGDGIVMPDFEVVTTLALTERNTTATTTFN